MLLRLIGEGGMGEVWLAREEPLGRETALKVTRRSPGETRARRFEREARALAALDHPSILPVLRAGTDPATGLRYLATRPILLAPSEITRLCDEVLRCPYPRGHAEAAEDTKSPLPLAALLDGGKALPEAAVLRIARDLASALAAAHAVGILHRAVKPSNILFDPAGRALLADFGLAKFTEAPPQSPDGRAPSRLERGSGAAEDPDSISLDESGSRKFLGSPAYAAPEQFRDGAALTPALDWYSLGAVLYEALTGERPRSLRPPSSFDRAHISCRWDPFLRDLLEPDPARRLADPAAITQRLDTIGRTIDPATRRRRRAARAALVAAAITAAVAGGVLLHAKPVPEVAEPVRGEGGGSGVAQPPPVAGIVPANPRLPLSNSVWQGDNLGPLQLLGAFRLAPVDDLFDEALAAADPEARRLVEAGDRACSASEPDLAAASRAWLAAAVHLRDIAGGPVARAAVLSRLSGVSTATGNPAVAIRFCDEALGLADPLAAADPARYGPLRSRLLAGRARAACDEGRLADAVEDLKEAGLLWARHAPADDPGCQAQFAALAASLGGAILALGDPPHALNPTAGAVETLQSLVGNPAAAGGEERLADPSTRLLADLLAGCHYRHGDILAAVGSRLEALAGYRSALDLWRALYRATGEPDPVAAAQVLGRIGQTCAGLGRYAEAVAAWDDMIAELRGPLAADPSSYDPVVAGVLGNIARASRALGDEERARACEAEAAALRASP